MPENPLPHIDSIIGVALELEGAQAEPQRDFTPILLDANGGQNFFERFRVSAKGDSRLPHAGGAPASGTRACAARPVATGRNGTRVRWSAPCPWLRPSGAARGSLPRPPPGFSSAWRARTSCSCSLRVETHRGWFRSQASLLPSRSREIVSPVGTRAPGVIVVLGPGGQRSEHQVPTRQGRRARRRPPAWPRLRSPSGRRG